MKLLIIRPEPGASASAARAMSAGFKVSVLPFFGVIPRAWDVPDFRDFDALLLTSANAVRHAGDGLAKLSALPVHAVGQQTADVAMAAGLQLASIGDRDAAAVLAQARNMGHQRLLWLAGQDHVALPDDLGTPLVLRVCYAVVPLTLPTDVAARIADTDAVALHSPRAARQLTHVVDHMGLDRNAITIAAFSAAIAKAAGTGWRHMVIATDPNDAALLSALQEIDRLPPNTPSAKDI